MRYLDVVIKDMIGVIPSDQVVLIRKLKDVLDSSTYAAPEIMGDVWRKTMAILIDEIGETREEWERTVAKIFCGRDAPLNQTDA